MNALIILFITAKLESLREVVHSGARFRLI